MKTAISVKNLTYAYDDKKILDDISVDFEDGKITTIIGPNGCGKTTFLKLLCNLIKPEKECVLINDKFVEQYDRLELAKTVSVLPQSRNSANILVEHLIEHGRFPYLGFARKLCKQDKEKVEWSMKTVGIYELRHKNIACLSGGERQKAYIAMTMAQDTNIIFMDEPTTYLDINHQYEFLNIIKKLNRQNNKTIIMVLHDLGHAMKYSDKIIVLDKGRIQYDGNSQGLLNDNSNVLSDVFKIKCYKTEINDKEEFVITHVN